MKHHEQKIGQALCDWWAYEAKRRGIDERLLFHIPNGQSKTSLYAGRTAKMAGVRAGIPDYFLAVPSNRFHGLFLELKTEKGKLTESQKGMIFLLDSENYCSCVAYGLDEAIGWIKDYLK